MMLSMRLSITLLFGLICTLTAVDASAKSRGQGCRLDLTPHFNVYANESIDSTRIHTSVLTDGYADFTPSAGCSGAGAVHTPKSYNLLSSTGGWGSGTGECMTCYLSFENDQSLIFSNGGNYIFDYTGEIDCSIFGAFFSSGGRIYLSLHTTYGAWTGGSSIEGNIRTCVMRPNCSSGKAVCGSPTYNSEVTPASLPCQTYVRTSMLGVSFSRLAPPTFCFGVDFPATGPGPCT